MIRIALGIVALIGWSQDDAKEEAKKAEQKIKEFKEAVKKAAAKKDESERVGDTVGAINELGTLQHAKVLAELKTWLTKPNAEIVQAAAENLSKYKKSKEAADAILKTALNQKDRDFGAKLIGLSGDVEAKELTKAYCSLFKMQGKELVLAEAGIQATGKVKSKDAIDPLIMLLKELDGIREDEGGNMGPPGNNNNPNIPSNPDRNNEQLERKRKLSSAANGALRDITGESFNKTIDWQTWWVKNKSTFKDPS